MKIMLFSDSRRIGAAFAAADRSRTCVVIHKAVSNLQDTLSELSARSSINETVCYIDLGDFEGDIKRLVRKYREDSSVRIGIIDTRRSISDPGSLFHLGVADYLGPELLKVEIPVKRLTRALDFVNSSRQPVDNPVRPRQQTGNAVLGSEGSSEETQSEKMCIGENLIPSRSWRQVNSGKEYTFALLYIQIDLVDEWRKKSGKDHLNKVTSAFHTHVKQVTSHHDGKVWMWTEQSGLVLFPFDGSGCPAIRTCMKLILDRILLSTEYYTYNTLVTYRMAIHIGNTVYRTRGKTGTLVSDTVNFLYHLGQKFLKPGNLMVTESAFPFIEPGLAECFLPVGTFEGYKIHRMRLPIG
jgi:hypothetical protein